MKTRYLFTLSTVAAACGLLALASPGCGAHGDSGDNDSNPVASQAQGEEEVEVAVEEKGGKGGYLHWFTTCGSVVCHGDFDDPYIPECYSETEGDPCSPSGALCEITGDACNRNLVCATKDPKNQPGGCPISQASAKHDIVYVSDADRSRIRDDVMTMPLATWKYNSEGQGEKEHLGFIIDDQPISSPAIRPSGERVDLYGYTSMAIAAIQAEHRDVEALRKEVASLREELLRVQAASRCTSR